ncbi:MAG: DUF3787 domain-containing protein [Tissierellia bacterium]|mgnify:CR=1 FL=1|nr:DUF3787 domain-containing protein [Tissierellia bacterium]
MSNNNNKNKNNKYKEKKMSIPIEENRYAAYYEMKELQPESRVLIPTLEGVIRAKEWVEENQK